MLNSSHQLFLVGEFLALGNAHFHLVILLFLAAALASLPRKPPFLDPPIFASVLAVLKSLLASLEEGSCVLEPLLFDVDAWGLPDYAYLACCLAFMFPVLNSILTSPSSFARNDFSLPSADPAPLIDGSIFTLTSSTLLLISSISPIS